MSDMGLKSNYNVQLATRHQVHATALTLNKAYLGMNVRGAASVAARENGLEGC